MPKLETPGELRVKISWCFMVGETGFLAYQEGGKERIEAMISARDAAIRAESADLLKTCGEALVLSREKVQQWVNEIYSAGGIEYIGLGSTLDKIDKALAALREAGVME